MVVEGADPHTISIIDCPSAGRASLQFYHTHTPVLSGGILYPVRPRSQIQPAGSLSLSTRPHHLRLEHQYHHHHRPHWPFPTKELTSTRSSTHFLFLFLFLIHQSDPASKRSHSKQSINKSTKQINRN